MNELFTAEGKDVPREGSDLGLEISRSVVHVRDWRARDGEPSNPWGEYVSDRDRQR